MWVLYRCLGTWWKMREKKGRGGCKNRCQVLNISPSLCSSLFIPPKTRVKFDFSPWLSPLHEYSFSVSALWCPLATLTILLGFLLPWTLGISSQLLQESTAAAPYLGWGYLLMATPPDLECEVSPFGPPAPMQLPLLGLMVSPLSCLPWTLGVWSSSRLPPWSRAWGHSSQPLLCWRRLALSVIAY